MENICPLCKQSLHILSLYFNPNLMSSAGSLNDQGVQVVQLDFKKRFSLLPHQTIDGINICPVIFLLKTNEVFVGNLDSQLLFI